MNSALGWGCFFRFLCWLLSLLSLSSRSFSCPWRRRKFRTTRGHLRPPATQLSPQDGMRAGKGTDHGGRGKYATHTPGSMPRVLSKRGRAGPPLLSWTPDPVPVMPKAGAFSYTHTPRRSPHSEDLGNV